MRLLVAAPRFVPGAAEGGGCVGSEGGGPGSGRFLRFFRPGGASGASARPAAPSPGGRGRAPRIPHGPAAERLSWVSWSGHGHAVPGAALPLSGI